MKCLALLALSGCSLVMVKGPRDTGNPPRTYPSCTSSLTYPVVDTVLAGLFLASMTTAIADNGSMDSTINDKDTRAERATSAGLMAALFGVSAYFGYTRVSRCRAAEDNFQRAYPNGMPYGYPYQPYYTQQPYPQQYPPAYPGTAPAPRPTPAPQPSPSPSAVPAANALGTEGDVCASNAECATGLACTNSVCVRPPPRATP